MLLELCPKNASVVLDANTSTLKQPGWQSTSSLWLCIGWCEWMWRGVLGVTFWPGATLCRPEQTYVCMWSHGRDARKHLPIAVQPVTAEVRARYGGLRSEQLQARMLADGDAPDTADVEQFCEQARELFREVTDSSVEDRS
jgi:hypothetical protein